MKNAHCLRRGFDVKAKCGRSIEESANRVYCNYNLFSGGGGHRFTVLETLQKSLIHELDKLRVEAQQRESEADKLVKDIAIGLEKWDTKTEKLVSQLHEARDKHASI